MATPKRKTSHARTAQRKAQWMGSLNAPSATVCGHCGDPVLSYQACPACGYYKGRKVVAVKEKVI
jgi:large subunit ribosomal protein L32